MQRQLPNDGPSVLVLLLEFSAERYETRAWGARSPCPCEIKLAPALRTDPAGDHFARRRRLKMRTAVAALAAI